MRDQHVPVAVQATPAAGSSRMRPDLPGVWRGVPRVPIDSSIIPTDVCVSVYPQLRCYRDRAQVSLSLGCWGMEISSTSAQLRELAALLVDAADLLDTPIRTEESADA